MRLTSSPRASIESLALIPHEGTDWSLVTASTYLIRQHLRYEYPVPISGLSQRLMIVPPGRHGDQRCIGWWVDVSQPVRRRDRRDHFGNRVIELEADHVEREIQFDSCVAVERRRGSRPHRVRPHRLWIQPSGLTEPDAELVDVARRLRAKHRNEVARAESICDWVHRRLGYCYGVTSVGTTAAQAVALGSGVCQDYAHIMLAVCRRAGLPARYVSGQLLGEGGSHAWVEVLLPDPTRVSSWSAMALDPTHGREVGLSYVTIATGRDYRDVAPTSGSYSSTRPGSLHSHKRVGLAALDYRTPRTASQSCAPAPNEEVFA